ncbi:alanyl-tRNA editing protein [Consotaella salsifontis]|uniref:Ala-tRNA(Pro) hydrolase n=1 Tax=Consotaella salsifontis TaxID=1365950 RepID=A0A1T4LDD0_9HYPH|nr:alanyl-tRNA editing protein [Consotaella salsifontis]SJZ52557.1 Ala-tRNA(Pro) hydrolase [Consotaella salsifontis]
MAATEILYRDDSYLRSTEAELVGFEGERGLVFDRSIFFATGGGQPGDTGVVRTSDGRTIRITDTVYGANRDSVVLQAAEPVEGLSLGQMMTQEIDWDRRLKLMRMHTACHLLSVVCPFPITGASVGEEESRVDFDIPDAQANKADVTAAMMALVEADHPIFTQWITDEELDANPGLVKSANVKPPRGSGRIRLVCIGENSSVDTQPCGGTHVARTSEVGAVHIGKIEKKGRINRRFRIRFGSLPQSG